MLDLLDRFVPYIVGSTMLVYFFFLVILFFTENEKVRYWVTLLCCVSAVSLTRTDDSMNEYDLLVKLGFNKTSVVPYPLEMRYLSDGSKTVMYCPHDLVVENRGEYGWSLSVGDTLLVDCEPFNVMYEVASALLRKI